MPWKKVWGILLGIVEVLNAITTVISLTNNNAIFSVGNWLPIGATIFFISTFALLGLGYWMIRDKEKIKQWKTKSVKPYEPNDAVILDGFEFHPHRESITWFKEELRKTQTAWCLWCAGGTAWNNKVLDIGSIRRVVLASPNEKVMIKKLAETVHEEADYVTSSIERVTKGAKLKGIDIRWWEGLSCNTLVFGNPNDDDAWVMFDLVMPNLPDNERPQVKIWKNRLPALYSSLLTVFNEIWDKSDKSLLINPAKTNTQDITLGSEYGDAKAPPNL